MSAIASRAAIAKETKRVPKYRDVDNALASPIQNVSTSRGKLITQSYRTTASYNYIRIANTTRYNEGLPKVEIAA